jgi:hypothetical protein
MKCNYPEEFWKVSCKHYENSSCLYKKWVYDIHIKQQEKKQKDMSIYASNRRKKMVSNFQLISIQQQLRLYGTWNMKDKKFFPKCYYYIDTSNKEEIQIQYFCGIIATSRRVGNKYIFFIGTDFNEFYEVIIDVKNIKTNIRQMIGMKGSAILQNKNQILFHTIDFTNECKYNKFKFF